LQRLASVMKFIAERGLAFRGDDKNIGSPRNFFRAIVQEMKMWCFWWPVLQRFLKSQIIVKYRVASKNVLQLS